MENKSIVEVSGIMIIVMVTGHIFQLCNQVNSSSSQWLFCFNFFMPWFYFKSGMFYREETNSGKLLKKLSKKLLYPFVIFNIVGWMINCIGLIIQHDFNWMHYVLTPFKELVYGGTTNGNQPLWFLTSIFMVRIIYNTYHKHCCKTSEMPNVFFLILCISVAFLCHRLNVTKPSYIASTFSGLFFYTSGYMLKNVQYRRHLPIVAVLPLLLICITQIPCVVMRSNLLYCGNYCLWFVYALLCCLLINHLFYIKRFNLRVLYWIGKNAMLIYVTHWIVLRIILISMNLLHFDAPFGQLYVYVSICFIFTVPVICKFLNSKKGSFLHSI